MLNFAFPSKDDPNWNSSEQLTLRESGLNSPYPAPPVDPNNRSLLPAGQGHFPLPPHLSTVGLINLALRSYYYAYDPALKKSRADAKACRDDPVVWEAILEAQTPITQLSWVVQPVDETNPKEADAARLITTAIQRTPNLQQVFRNLLEALWFGRAGVQFTYEWDKYQPQYMVVSDWSPLQGDSLVARWANRDWGMLVNAAFEGETEAFNLGRAHYFTPSEMEAVLIHQSEREPPDFFDSIGAGSIRGIGWRARIFWYWYIKANIFAIMIDLMERLGSGIWVARYDQSNPQGKVDFENAIAAYKNKRVLSIPGDAQGNSKYGLEIIEPGATNHNIIEHIIRYLDGAIRAVILGHPMGAGAEINVGGDPTALYGDAISRTTKYHANNLAETITRSWLPVYYKYMCPNVRPGKFSFVVDHPNADAILKYSQVLVGLGYSVDLDEIASICGVPKGNVGSTIATNVQSLNPMPLQQGTPPEGVPIATNNPQQVTNANTTAG